MAEKKPDQAVLEFIVKTLVNYPDAVEVKRMVDEMGVVLSLKVDPRDMGLIIGRAGSTAKALRTLLRIVGIKNNARVSLKVEEPAGGRGPRDRESENDEDMMGDLKI